MHQIVEVDEKLQKEKLDKAYYYSTDFPSKHECEEKPSRQNVPQATPPPTLKLGVSYKDGAHSEPTSRGQLREAETP